MRWLIGVLLAGNLVLLLWQLDGRDAGEVRSPEPDVGELRLLDGIELAGGGAPDDVSSAADPVLPEEGTAERPVPAPDGRSGEGGREAPVPPPAERLSGPAVTAREEGERETVSPALPPSAVTREEEMGQTPAEVAPAAVVASDSQEAVAEAGVPGAVESGEPPADETESGSAAGAADAGPSARGGPGACWGLGPFEEAVQAEALAAELPPGVRKLAVRKTEVRVPNGFYVLVPASPTRAGALAIVRQLKQKGIKDSWVFVSGPLKNAVSLGLFSREANARRRLTLVLSKGFDARLLPRYREREQVELLVAGPADTVTERALKRLSANQLKPAPCP